MVLEQARGLGRLFVTTVDEDHALAVKLTKGMLGAGSAARDQCAIFGPASAGFRRPACALADVHVADVGAVFGDLGK